MKLGGEERLWEGMDPVAMTHATSYLLQKSHHLLSPFRLSAESPRRLMDR